MELPLLYPTTPVMKRSGELKTKTPLKRSGFKNSGSLNGRSAKKSDGDYQFNSTFKKRVPSVRPSGPLASGGTLKQHVPIKAKREEPRRRLPERIQQERIAPKAGEKPNALESQHMDRVAKMPCLVCGRASTVHHVTGYADRMGRFARSHKCVVPLCPKHHQKVFDPVDADPISVEGLGHRKFFEKHGKDLFAIANQLWEQTVLEIDLNPSP